MVTTAFRINLASINANIVNFTHYRSIHWLNSFKCVTVHSWLQRMLKQTKRIVFILHFKNSLIHVHINSIAYLSDQNVMGSEWPISVTCNLNSNIKPHACVLNEHFTGVWMLLPICDIVNRAHWHFVYSLGVNDAGTGCWCQWKLYAVKWAVMSVFVNTCSLLPLWRATLRGTARVPS